MNYGVQYKGSKNRIAKDIISVLPSGKRFVDLFAGGCAVTQAALLSGKYEKVLCNDLQPNGITLFRQALEGEFNKPEYFRWVSREEFFEKKDTDPFVRLVFSFGNDGATYMYGKEIEPLKKGFHYAVVYDDWTYLEQYAKEHNWKEGLLDSLKKSVEGIGSIEQRRMATERQASVEGLQEPNQTFSVHLLRKKRLDEINQRRITADRFLKHNTDLNPRQCMAQHLSRLNGLQEFDNEQDFDIDFTSVDYRNYKHEDGDVVYCDPPYQGTWKYDGREFDHAAFYEWVRTRDYPVYFSEYSAPDDFISIWQKDIPKKGAGGKSAHQKATEKVFVHNRWMED